MLREQAEVWIYRDPDDATRKELQDLLDTNQHAELEDRFRGRLSFGTGSFVALWVPVQSHESPRDT